MYMSVVPVRSNAAANAGSANGTGVGKAGRRRMRTAVLIGMMAASLWLGAHVHVNAAVKAATDAAAVVTEDYVLYTVEPGDSLWTIAKRHLPENKKLAAFIHEIRTFNGMASSHLQAGETLKIPVQP